MDAEHWTKVKKANRRHIPDLSRVQCDKLTKIERRQYDGLEANVKDCEGYSPFKKATSFILGKLGSVEHKIKRTEAGGTRTVSWHERACNNPYLESEEYFKLSDEFQDVGTNKSSRLAPFKTEKQQQAFIEDQAGQQKAIAGAGAILGGLALTTQAGEGIADVAGIGIAGVGLYYAGIGVVQSGKNLLVQMREARGHEE